MSAAPKFTPGPWEWAPVGNGFFLRTPDRGQLVVMDMVRRQGIIGTPRFAIMDDNEPRGRRGGILRDVDPSTHPDGRLIATAPELAEALRDVMALVDSCVLVRNTSGDDAPDWASKQLPLIMTLKRAADVLAKVAP